jgi:hypothetical protein
MSYERMVKKKGLTPNKKVINDFIASTMLTQAGKAKAIVMDGTSYGSARAMVSAGVSKKNIISFGDEISSKARPAFKALRANSTDVLNHYSDTLFRVIFLDYMTNKVSEAVLADMEIAACMVGKQGILIVTFSLCVRNSGP